MKKFRPLFWVLVVLILIASVGVVVYFAFFGDKDTKALATGVKSYSTSGYLADVEDGEYQKIMSYLNKLDTTLSSEEDKKELENFKDGYEAYLNVAEFFEREAPFMQVTKSYRRNKKTIIGKLASAQKDAKNLVKQIDTNAKIAGDSEFWQKVAWTDCKDLMKNLLFKTMDAYNTFADVYKASVKSNLLNNDYSTIMFDALARLSAIVKEEYQKDAKCGANLKTFTALYFTKDGETQILKYAYSDNDGGSTFRATVLDINEKGSESASYQTFISSLLTEGGV